MKNENSTVMEKETEVKQEVIDKDEEIFKEELKKMEEKEKQKRTSTTVKDFGKKFSNFGNSFNNNFRNTAETFSTIFQSIHNMLLSIVVLSAMSTGTSFVLFFVSMSMKDFMEIMGAYLMTFFFVIFAATLYMAIKCMKHVHKKTKATKSINTCV